MSTRSWLGRLIVFFVTCLISFIAYSSQIFIIWPWYGGELSVSLLLLLLPFNSLVAMLFWNYFLCVFTNPGRVPDSWTPDTHEDGYEVKKLTGGPRYCRVCKKFKPPRTHHCRQCDTCVLRMDHHCPWIDNCVGHFNHGHFIRFLFYVDLACTYHIIMVTRRVLDASRQGYWDEPSTSELVFIIMNYVTCAPVLLAVGGFSLYHFFGLLGNSTTIEGWEKDKVATMVRRGKIREVKFPYDLGKRRNIESILGVNPLLWCWPTVTPGNGLKYRLSDHDDRPEAWPPRDPATVNVDRTNTLSASPWTFENGGLNPNLQPSNMLLQRSTSRRTAGHDIPSESTTLPPYHPDYNTSDPVPYEPNSSEDDTISISSDWEPSDGHAGARVRRGSEGYEVRSEGREDMLRRYLEQLGEEPGRYIRYIPNPGTDSEDDDIPLGQTLESRVHSTTN